MGCLVLESSLSALSSCHANFCPTGLDLKQFSRTYNGSYGLNFILALSGSESFKNLNFTNFYLTNNLLIRDVTTFNNNKILPEKFYTSLNFGNCGKGYIKFMSANHLVFEDNGDPYNAAFYGYAGIGTTGDNFEITIIDDYTCRVAYIDNNFRYYLVVSDEAEIKNKRDILFVGENKIPLSGATLEYSFQKYKFDEYINLFSTKTSPDGNNYRYIIESTGGKLIATKLLKTDNLNELYITPRNIKLNQEIDFTVPSPYNTSFITYTSGGRGIDGERSDLNLTSNYLLYTSSNNECQDFNLFNLKNIANNNDGFTSSNNLLSTSPVNIFASNLRNYTSLFTDIDSERNESISLNYVYNNYNIVISTGTTIFTTPSSLNPFTKININDTKLADCGSYAFKQPYLADRVYRFDNNSVRSENATYLCTWLSGAVGTRGKWVDRYYYPDLASKEDALNGKSVFNVTYQNDIENLIRSNASLKTSVTDKIYFDKNSDMVFEANRRYKYERIQRSDFVEKTPTNFCETATLNKTINDYYLTIDDNGGFGLGYTIQNNTGDFVVRSGTTDLKFNNLKPGFEIAKTGNTISFTFNVFDNSKSPYTIEDFTHSFEVDPFEKNNIFLSFNSVQGKCTLYLNSQDIFSFYLNTFQMFTKKILFGDIYVNGGGNNVELLRNQRGKNLFIENVYLALEPLTIDDEAAAIFNQSFDPIQDITISLPCGMRNLTDNITTVNSINTNLKSKSNRVDININNLNINDQSITDTVKNTILANIEKSIPKTIGINNINFINYK